MSKANTFGKYIKKERESLGFSQSELAKKLNYSTGQFISNWERGISYPPTKSLKKVVKLLQLNPKMVLTLILSEKRKKISKAVGLGVCV